jgi:hypothetical protein
MRRSLLTAVAAASALASPPAFASLVLNVADVRLSPTPTAVTRPVEVFFTESAPAENEQLRAYHLRINLDNKGTGITLVPPGTAPTAHPWVLPAGSSFTDFNSTTATVRIAADTTTPQNIDHNEGVLRFSVRIPADTAPGVYPLSIVGSETGFANGNGQELLFPVRDGAVIISGPDYLAADANGDGRVDVADLGILATHFNNTPPSPPGRPSGDFNGDGTVNVADLGILATYFNQPHAAAANAAGSWQQALAANAVLQTAIPEPAALALLASTVGALTLRRRRPDRTHQR